MLVAAALVLGQCGLPRCTTLETTGSWSGETFVPSVSPNAQCQGMGQRPTPSARRPTPNARWPMPNGVAQSLTRTRTR